jgi:hypothetical protein
MCCYLNATSSSYVLLFAYIDFSVYCYFLYCYRWLGRQLIEKVFLSRPHNVTVVSVVMGENVLSYFSSHKAVKGVFSMDTQFFFGISGQRILK